MRPFPSTVMQAQTTPLRTPVLQKEPSTAIVVAKRAGLFPRRCKDDQREQKEIPVMSLAQAQDFLHESGPGSVLIFVHSEAGQSRSAAMSPSSRRHPLYISYKYRRTHIHFEYRWVNLKEKSDVSRRQVFYVEQRCFDILKDLIDSFIPALRTWLSAIVKTANFVDESVESVDLKALLCIRHHLILTRRTPYMVGVVMFKLDQEAKRIDSKAIVFDFKLRRICDDKSTILRNFHEIFQQFLGLHLANPLMPSPREEDEDEPHMTLTLLDGLELASVHEQLRRLSRLQNIVRRGAVLPEHLELTITLLLPHLVHADSSGIPASAASSIGDSTGYDANPSVDSSPASNDAMTLLHFSETQILVCDSIAELCEQRVEAIGPHIWRMCRGCLGDSRWHACILALGLLTLMSRRLTEWLACETDAAVQLCVVFMDAHHLLISYRDAALAPVGRGQVATPKMSSRSDVVGNSGSARSGRMVDWSPSLPHVAAHASEHVLRHSNLFPPQLQESRSGVAAHGTTGPTVAGGRTVGVEPSQRSHIRNPLDCGCTLSMGSRHNQQVTREIGRGNTIPASSLSLHRTASFDDFEALSGPRVDQNVRGHGSHSVGSMQEEEAPSPRPWFTGVGAHFEEQVSAAESGSVRGETRNSRRVRVPPLNLDLASRLHGSSPPSSGQVEGANSMTRSSRRLRQALRVPVAPPAPSNGGVTLGLSSRSTGASLLSSVAHSLSAPLLGLRFVGSCYMSPPSSGSSTPSQSGTIRNQGPPMSTTERQALQQAEDLAKALGEACLFADLSSLLKIKQEQQVHDAVMDKIRPGFSSPGKPSSCTVTPRTNAVSVVRPSPGVTTSMGSASQATSPSLSVCSLHSTRAAAHCAVPPLPTSNGSAAHPMQSTGSAAACNSATCLSAPADIRSARVALIRRIRLHVLLLMERFCMITPRSVRILGPHVPVNDIFDILQASCSRSGVCSFSFNDTSDWDDSKETVLGASVSSGLATDSCDGAQLRGLLQQKLPQVRLQQMVQLHSRIQQSWSSRRCICAASSAQRGACEELCICVDDTQASCMWRLLSMHAEYQAQATQTCKDTAMGFPPAHLGTWTAGDSAAARRHEKHAYRWHVQLGADAFLKQLARALGQAILHLRSIQCATTAGPDAVGSSQVRIAFLLRLCSVYIRISTSRTHCLQVFHAVGMPLLAVKDHLCCNTDAASALPLPAHATRLWVAYLQLVGALLWGAVRYAGISSPQFAKVVLIQFLDLPPNPSSQSVGPAAAAAAAAAAGHVTSLTSRAVAGSVSPSRSAHRTINKSHSLRSLQGVPPRLPHSGERSAAGNLPTVSVAKGLDPGRTIWGLFPRVVDRIFSDTVLDEPPPMKCRQDSCEEGATGFRCRVLGFVVAVLESSRAILGASSRTTTVPKDPPHEDTIPSNSARQRMAYGHAIQQPLGIIGIHDHLCDMATATADSLSDCLLEWLQFLFLPPSGLVCRLSKSLPLAGGPLIAKLVLCERALFRSPAVVNTVYVREASVSEFYVRRHFLAFVRLYTSCKGDCQAGSELVCLCRLHLQVLLAMVSLRSDTDMPRTAFHQLSVLDFLAGEIDLEHETTQMRDRFLWTVQRQASRASGCSNSSVGSCASSPAIGAGGRALVISTAVLPVMSASLPPAATPPDGDSKCADIGFAKLAGADDSATAGPTKPSVLTTSSTTTTTTTTNTVGTVFREGARSKVPKLHFRGMPASLQGTGMLGLPPPEEPQQVLNSDTSFGPAAGQQAMAPIATTLPPVPPESPNTEVVELKKHKNLAVGEQHKSSIPKLSFDVLAEQSKRDGTVTALPPPAGEIREHGSGLHEQQACHIGELHATGIDSCIPDASSLLAADERAWQCCTDGGLTMNEAPRSSPPVIPKLAIQTMGSGNRCLTKDVDGQAPGIGMSPATSRSSALGAGGRSPAITPQSTPFSSTGGSARRSSIGSALGSDRRPQSHLAGASPRGPLSDVAGRTVAKRLVPQPQSLCANDDWMLNGFEAQAPSCLSGSETSTDRSPCSSGCGSRACDRFAMAKRPGRSSVPRLSFMGIRPSLQGTSGLGAPPPEEPTMSELPGQNGQVQLGAASLCLGSAVHSVCSPRDSRDQPHPTHPLSPPPPSNSNSDDSSEVGQGEDDGCTVADGVTGCQRPQDDSSDADTEDAHQVRDTQGNEFAVDDSSSDQDCDCDNLTVALERPNIPPVPRLLVPEPRRVRVVGVRNQVNETVANKLSASCGPAVLPSMSAGKRPVPKLLLHGVPQSLQGCSGIGAAPPEEPGTEPPPAPPSGVGVATLSNQPKATRSISPALGVPTVTVATMPRVASTESLPPGSAEGGIECESTTPTASGYQSPVAGSACSAPATEVDLSCMDVIHQNLFYFEGRQRRWIYCDDEMHTLILALILALLVKPEKGLLDPRYCHQQPLAHKQRNILFLLSLHLNHSANKGILPQLTQHVDSICHTGALRPLKLLCENSMHRWMYANWTRLAGGTFGTVYRCDVLLGGIGTVAIKQISKQASIQDRCVCHDVFSEVACLDAVRFESHVCQLFDYGVDESGYWIVMRYYPTSLKKWRGMLNGSLNEHLPLLLVVYRQILKAIQALHRHGIVHYDLKCDNIMVDVDMNSTNQIPCIAVADFGESRMMAAEDELDTRNRGTEIVKCPEMLEFERISKKEASHFDRRKRLGTNEAADIWSLGCLIFELLTTRFLFQDDDYGTFYCRVTGKMLEDSGGDVISDANKSLLDNNRPVIDFIHSMLPRDPQRRPNIDTALDRFDIVASEALKFASSKLGVEQGVLQDQYSLHSDAASSIADSPRSMSHSIGGSSACCQQSLVESLQHARPLICATQSEITSCFTRILDDFFVLEASDEDVQRVSSCACKAFDSISLRDVIGPGTKRVSNQSSLQAQLTQRSWTHVVDFRPQNSQQLASFKHTQYVLALQTLDHGNQKIPSAGFQFYLTFCVTLQSGVVLCS